MHCRKVDNGSYTQIFTRSSLKHNALSPLDIPHSCHYVDGPPSLFKTILNSHTQMKVKQQQNTWLGLSFQAVFPCMKNFNPGDLSLQRAQRLPYQGRGQAMAPGIPEHWRITILPAWILQLQ